MLFVLLFSLMTNWRFTCGVEEQTKVFLDGFSEVVPLQWLQYFDEREIEVSTSASEVTFFIINYILTLTLL